MKKENEKILLRIKKLFALGAKKANNSVHESSAAIKKAYKLMNQYNISMSREIIEEIETKNDSITKMGLGKEYSSEIPLEFMRMCMLVKNLYDCEGKIEYTNKFKIQLHLYGYRVDLIASQWTFNYLVGELNRCFQIHWKEIKNLTNSTRHMEKKAFMWGFSDALQLKIQEMKKKEEYNNNEESGLVLFKKKNIEEKFGDFSYKQVTRNRIQPGGYNQGHSAGKKTNLNKPIPQKSRRTKWNKI